MPVLLVAIPLGATISLQVGQIVAQLGAQSFTGTAVVVGLVREAAPIATALAHLRRRRVGDGRRHGRPPRA